MRATQVCGYEISPNKTRVDRFADVKGMDIGFTFRKSDEPDGGYNFYTFEHTGMVLRFSLSIPLLFKYVLMSSLRSQ